ncbi:hypothetical protein [Mycobacterium haemophilum]|uniref:hypothetical protein n=1 Tax=Mycobacterium haemophilum TaxID=29311 RepID=UPI000699A83A|nr:hypothetical protein [Mycobacterium haemophilum]
MLVTAVTAAELRHSVARLPEGRRKRELHIKIDGLLTADFEGQILPFDAPAAATHYAEIVASRERAGRPIRVRSTSLIPAGRAQGVVYETARLLAAERLHAPDEAGVPAFPVRKFAFGRAIHGPGWIEAKIS